MQKKDYIGFLNTMLISCYLLLIQKKTKRWPSNFINHCSLHTTQMLDRASSSALTW